MLPLAQRHGLTTRLALWTIERALADRRLLAADLGVEVVVSVNIAARDLLGHAFVPDIARLLQADAAGAPPGPRLTRARTRCPRSSRSSRGSPTSAWR